MREIAMIFWKERGQKEMGLLEGLEVNKPDEAEGGGVQGEDDSEEDDETGGDDDEDEGGEEEETEDEDVRADDCVAAEGSDAVDESSCPQAMPTNIPSMMNNAKGTARFLNGKFETQIGMYLLNYLPSFLRF
jgi:hypothetical protein